MKKIKLPNPTVIIFGGPNFPYSENEQLRFLKRNSEIDAYVLSDEVYRGAELDGIESSSFFGN